MTRLEILALAFALAADAFTVGAVVGLTHSSPRQIFRLSYHFGLFQSLLALAGALLGTLLMEFIAAWDHWIVFAVLTLLGIRMVTGAFESNEKKRAGKDLTRGMALVGLSVAVSIDAFGAGVGLPAAHAPLIWTITTIGAITTLATVTAMMLADRLHKWGGRRIEIIAGILLILLGARMLLSHLIG